jgi:hypothetical protein
VVTDGWTTVWDLLGGLLVEDDENEEDAAYEAAITSLLRAWCCAATLRSGKAVVAGACTGGSRGRAVHARMVRVGARLQAGLPAYLARRQALLAEHCPLIAPLRDLVRGYEMPTTTEELWATGLGAMRRPEVDGATRQRAARPRADDGAATAPLRRLIGCARSASDLDYLTAARSYIYSAPGFLFALLATITALDRFTASVPTSYDKANL